MRTGENSLVFVPEPDRLLKNLDFRHYIFDTLALFNVSTQAKTAHASLNPTFVLK